MKAKARRKNNKKIIKKKNIDWAYFDIVLPLVQKDDLDNTNPKKKILLDNKQNNKAELNINNNININMEDNSLMHNLNNLHILEHEEKIATI